MKLLVSTLVASLLAVATASAAPVPSRVVGAGCEATSRVSTGASSCCAGLPCSRLFTSQTVPPPRRAAHT